MNSTFVTTIAKTPVRIRVAFVLSIADRVLPALNGNNLAYGIANDALRDAWKWVEGGNLRAIQLYNNHIDYLACEGPEITDELESNSFLAVISAFYYVVWHAFQHDLVYHLVSEGDVPNDIAEVSENVIAEVCEFALQTKLCSADYLASKSSQLMNQFYTLNSNELGPLVSRSVISDY